MKSPRRWRLEHGCKEPAEYFDNWAWFKGETYINVGAPESAKLPSDIFVHLSGSINTSMYSTYIEAMRDFYRAYRIAVSQGWEPD